MKAEAGSAEEQPARNKSVADEVIRFLKPGSNIRLFC